MSVRVTRDGTIVHFGRPREVGGKTIISSSATTCFTGATFPDEKVSEADIARARLGKRGLEYVDDDTQDEPEVESDGGSKSEVEDDLYSPTDHVQDDVLEYLATADEAEVTRVKAAEAEGKGRAKIAEFEFKKPDQDGSGVSE